MFSNLSRRLNPARSRGRMLRAALSLATLVAAPAGSQALVAADSTPRLSLADVYERVLAGNPKVQASRALADAAATRVTGASLLPDPEVQLGFMNYDVSRLRPMDPLGMVQLQVMQMIPTSGKRSLAGRIAGARANGERERAREVGWEQRTRAAMAFYELFEAEQGIAIATGTRQLVQDVARIAQAMYEVGEGNQADVLRAQVEIARMTEEIARMEAMQASAAARLLALLDQSDRTLPRVVRPRFPEAMPDEESLRRIGLQERPMIRAGQSEVDAAGAMATKARKELVPDLVVGVTYGQRSAAMGTERMGSLMLGASVPLFAGRRQLKWREEADAMRAMSTADLAWMKADTRGRIGEAMAMLNRARRLSQLYRTTVLPQAEAAVSSAVAAYRVGRVDFMTVLDGRMTVNRFRMELVALQAEEGKAWAELEMLTAHEMVNARTAADSTSGETND